jgi:hypothetical protein
MLHHAQDSQYLDMSLCKKILLWQDISVWFGFRESNACANTNAASIFTKHTLGFQCPMVTKKVQATSPLSDILVVLSCHFGGVACPLCRERQVPFNRKNILRNNAVSMTAAMVQVVQIAPLPSSMA